MEMWGVVDDVPADEFGDEGAGYDGVQQVQSHRNPGGLECEERPLTPTYGLQDAHRERHVNRPQHVGDSEYTYVIVCLRSGASWLKVSQMTPSVSCWIPKSSGIVARGCSLLAFVFLSAATPTADSEVPAMKLAEAEKHIG